MLANRELALGLIGQMPPAQRVAALFSRGEQLGWYDPSNFASMSQDAAGTTPVTAFGQPVGLRRDLSGRGNHAVQPTSASRAILRQDARGFAYLDYDGIDDFYRVPSVAVGSDKIAVCAGIYRPSGVTSAVICEFSPNAATNNGAFSLTSASTSISFRSTGTASVTRSSSGLYAGPVTTVALGQGDISGDIARLTVNGSDSYILNTDQGSGNYGTYDMYIGSRAGTSVRFYGREYGLIVLAGQATERQLSAMQAFMNSKTGAY